MAIKDVKVQIQPDTRLVFYLLEEVSSSEGNTGSEDPDYEKDKDYEVNTRGINILTFFVCIRYTSNYV